MPSAYLEILFIVLIFPTVQELMACETGIGQAKHDFNQKNIRLVPSNIPAVLEVKINGSGCVVQEKGVTPHFLKWISHRFAITYSWEPIDSSEILVVEDTPTRKGLEADVIAGGITLTVERFRSFDFTFPWWIGSFVLMIPFPKPDVNNKALFQPFQREVWVCLVLGFISVIACWYVITMVSYSPLSRKDENLTLSNGGAIVRKRKRKLFRPLEYAFSVLLSQGNFCLEISLPIRLVASAWCLAAFVLYPAYSGTLTSFIMSPSIKPVVNSIRDVENVVGLSIAVDRGLATDVLLQSVSKNETVFERLINHLKPSMLRCNATKTCLDGVRTGRYLYAHTMILVNNVIFEERKHSGKCSFTRAKEPFQAALIAMGVAKGSPFLNTINTGLMEMHAFGLLNYWNAEYFKEAQECIRITKIIKRKQLKVAEFGTTFMVLGVGYAIGGIVFFGELSHRIFRFNSLH